MNDTKSLCACPYPNCRNTNVEHIETYPTVVEFFCRTCKRYFSKAVPHTEKNDCPKCDDSKIAWDDPKNPCDCPCHDAEIVGA